MNDPLREIAYAKINLALHVRAREADGYHRIETLFAFAADGDVLTARPAPDLSLDITGPFGAALASEPDNLILRAARALRAATGISDGAHMLLDKRLPVASGIGGGSADAAAALRLLKRLWGLSIDDAALHDLARPLGADVPACLLSRTCRGEGRGDDLVPLDAPQLRAMPLLLVNPGVAVSTASIFRAWDGIDRGALERGDPLRIAQTARNDLERLACALAPVINEVLALLRQQAGVHLTRMSGSGATCFALFDQPAARDAAAHAIAQARPDWWQLSTELR